MSKLIVGVGALALLLVVADQVAKGVVEHRLADHVEQRENAQDVEVEIMGFPFLTQVVQNQFGEVDVSMPRLEAATVVGDLQVERLEVTLRDVETSDRYQRATAQSVAGSGSIPYSSFDAFSPLQVDYGGVGRDGQSVLVVTLPGAGRLHLQPSIVDGTSLDLESLGSLPGAVAPSVRSLIDRPLSLAGVPDGLTVESVDATAEGLDVTVTGTDVTIAE